MLKKRCGGCKIEKDISNFYKNKRKKDGYQNYCVSCIKKTNADSFQKHKKKRMAKSLERQRSERGIAYHSDYYKHGSKRKREVAKQEVTPEVYQQQHVEHRAQYMATTHDERSKVNHERYERNKSDILAQQKEYRAKKKVRAESIEVVLISTKKTCSECNNEKLAEEFNKNKNICRNCQKIYRAQWYKKNQESEKAKAKIYATSNPEKIKENWDKWYGDNRNKRIKYSKKWRTNNPKYKAEYREVNRVHINEQGKKRARERYATDTQYNIKCKLRARLHAALNGKSKAASTMKLTGGSISVIGKYLEAQFTNEMSWENMGVYWHIDHFIPFAAFDLTIDTNQFVVCWYKNYQPLPGPENIAKGAKYKEEDKQDLIRRYNEAHLS